MTIPGASPSTSFYEHQTRRDSGGKMSRLLYEEPLTSCSDAVVTGVKVFCIANAAPVHGEVFYTTRRASGSGPYT